MIPTLMDSYAVLLAVVAWPATHGRGAVAKVTAAGSHAVAWRVTLGTETVGFLKLAIYALRAIEHPACTVALTTEMIAPKVPLTAHASHQRSGGRCRTLPSPPRIRRRSRRTPRRLGRRGGAGARDRSSAPPRCCHDPRSMGAQGALDSSWITAYLRGQGPSGASLPAHPRGRLFFQHRHCTVFAQPSQMLYTSFVQN